MRMRLVVVESPYAGPVPRNLAYLRACMADSLKRGEAPFASHGLYTQPGVLDDTLLHERTLGMSAGFAWNMAASLTAVYQDFGISGGMRAGINHAVLHARAIEYRRLDALTVERIRTISSESLPVACTACGKGLAVPPMYCIKCPIPEER